MHFLINKVEDNRDFLENKNFSIHTKNDNGTTTIQNNILALCDRVWIDKEFIFEMGLEYIYEIKLPDGEIWESKVMEKGNDEYGNYIVIIVPNAMKYAYEGTERPHIPIGQMDINIILSPEMIKGSDKLLEAFGNGWPSFHEAHLTIIEKTDKDMILKFSGGFLDDKVVDVKISGIVNEIYDESLEYFTGQWLTSVEFRKRGSNFEVRLYNDYYISKSPEGFDTSVFNDPDFDRKSIQGLYTKEEHKNHGVIICNELEISVAIDIERKRQLEEKYRRFLENCNRQ